MQKYYRRAIVNNTYDLKSIQDAIQASLYHCSSTDQRPAADVQRVLHRGAFLIKEDETDQREFWHSKISTKILLVFWCNQFWCTTGLGFLGLFSRIYLLKNYVETFRLHFNFKFLFHHKMIQNTSFLINK